MSDTVLAAFPQLTCARSPAGVTVLCGPVKDNSDVLSILALIYDVGLSVVEMRQLPD